MPIASNVFEAVSPLVEAISELATAVNIDPRDDDQKIIDYAKEQIGSATPQRVIDTCDAEKYDPGEFALVFGSSRDDAVKYTLNVSTDDDGLQRVWVETPTRNVDVPSGDMEQAMRIASLVIAADLPGSKLR